MGRQATLTKLSLAEWAHLMGINPIQFWQVQLNGSNNTPNLQKNPVNSGCNQAWFKYEWQDIDRVGRDQIARCIRQAEDQLEQYFGFRLMPDWEADEWARVERPYRPELIKYNGNIRGYNDSVQTRWQYLIAPGVRASTLVSSAAPIVYTDTDSDGYFETATVGPIATVLTDPCEIKVFYPGKSGSREWEIRPAEATISGGNLTITFRRELCVLAALEDALLPTAVDGTTNGSFLTTADVYRVYNDTTTQGTLAWEPVGGCNCGDGSCVQCAFTVQTACLYRRGDDRLGSWAYQPAAYDATDGWAFASPSVCRAPDNVRLWYFSGYRSKDASCNRVTMDPQLAHAVAYLAGSKLDRPLCDQTKPTLTDRMRDDLSLVQSRDQGQYYNISSSDLDNPFGTKRGEVMAWKMVRQGFYPVALGVVST